MEAECTVQDPHASYGPPNPHDIDEDAILFPTTPYVYGWPCSHAVMFPDATFGL